MMSPIRQFVKTIPLRSTLLLTLLGGLIGFGLPLMIASAQVELLHMGPPNQDLQTNYKTNHIFLPLIAADTQAEQSVLSINASGISQLSTAQKLARISDKESDLPKSDTRRDEASPLVKGYTVDVVLALGDDTIIDDKIDLVSQLSTQCNVDPPNPNLALELLYSPIKLSTSDENTQGESNEQHGTEPKKEPNRVIGAYAITDSRSSVEEVISWINEPCRGSNLSIQAEPNYIFSSHQLGFKDGPFGFTDAPNENDTTFRQQWALHTIDVLDQSNSPVSLIEGLGVKVGVFDTSPFTNTSIYSYSPLTLSLNIDNSFFVEGYGINGPLAASACQIGAEDIPLNEHGMHVASLIHAVAPQSTITLYQVMNHCGQGDLAHLFPALDQFIIDVRNSQNQLGVINMSLGASKEFANTFDSQNEPQNSPITLQALLDFARNEGIATVASAGNDSYYLDDVKGEFDYGDNSYEYGFSISPPYSSTWPARIHSVIGVAATGNYSSNKRTCYSNRVDQSFQGVAAPGGGIQTIIQTNTNTLGFSSANMFGFCTSDFILENLCVLGQNCLIGLNSNGKFSYLLGTSYAAPLVSGIAALIKGDQLATSSNIGPCSLIPMNSVTDHVLTVNDPNDYLGLGIARYRPPSVPSDCSID